MKEEDRYLINSFDIISACHKANEIGIQRKDWDYVPDNERRRFEVLAGKHNFKKDRLIGRFTDEEIFMLTGEKR